MVNKSLSSSWIFFLFTFIYSWSLWILGILIGQDFTELPTYIFYILGGVGPSLIGIILILIIKQTKLREDFRSRVINFKYISLKWYGIMFFFVLFPILLGILMDLLLGGLETKFEGLRELISNPVGYSTYVIFLILAVLAEEFGWRGYALDNLQKKYTALHSSLIIGIFWSIWHFPLYFIKGTFQNNLGFNSSEFYLYSIAIIPESILYTLIYNNNNRSILSVIIFHFMVNFFGELFSIQLQAQLFRVIIIFLFAVIYTSSFGPNSLVKKNNKQI
jgi:membrane protease YdiL (CAAX protease family)